MKKKLIAALLVATSILTAVGCMSTPVEEDSYLTLSVDESQLVDETPEVIEKDINELWHVNDVIEINGKTFARVIPGDAIRDKDTTYTTLYYNDANFLETLALLGDDIYFDINPKKLSKDDSITEAIDIYLNGLTNEELIQAVKDANAYVNSFIKPPENLVEEKPSEQGSEGENPEGEPAAQDEQPADQQEEQPADGETPEGESEAEGEDGTIIDPFSILEQYEDGRMGENGIYLSDEEAAAYKEQYKEYMNFMISRQIVLYDKDGALLGTYTAHQLKSYYHALNGDAAPYDLVSGYINSSDLLEDITYTTKALDNKNGSFEIRFKNTTGKPEILFIASADGEEIIPLFSDIFTVTGYYPKGEWYKSGLVTDYNFRILSFESDADIFNYMEENGIEGTLRLSKVQPDEKGKYKIDSNYVAFMNDLSSEVQLTSDTKHVEKLAPGEVIGVAKDKQSNFKMVIITEEN